MTSNYTTSETMPPSQFPLTLIVATTLSRGIGLKGNLPWPPLKSDLAFFARVTKRVPAGTETNASTGRTRNAVIMGRKTWESIPPKFRPLRDRINVIITRSPDKLRPTLESPGGDVFATTSLEGALKELKERYTPGSSGETSSSSSEASDGQAAKTTAVGRSFVIGGAEIYNLALKATSCQRVLWTRLNSDFECDTFFPKGVLTLPEDTSPEAEQSSSDWAATSNEALQAWTEETSAGESKKDGDVEYQVVMLEKKAAGSHG